MPAEYADYHKDVGDEEEETIEVVVGSKGKINFFVLFFDT